MVPVLKDSMGQRESSTLLLLLCKDPEEMVHLLHQLQNIRRQPITCENSFEDYLIEMIKFSLSTWSKSTDTLQRWWEAVFKVLGKVQIGYTKSIPQFVIDAIVEHSTYRTRKSFHVYSTLQEMMCPEHPLYDKLSELLTENLCINLEHLSVTEQTISTVDFLGLLNSRAGAFLLWGRGQNTIMMFARYSIKRLNSFTKSITYIGNLFALVTARPFVRDPTQMVCDLISQTRVNVSQSIWLEAFSAAKASPMLLSTNPALIAKVAEIIFPMSNGHLLLKEFNYFTAFLKQTLYVHKDYSKHIFENVFK